MPAYFDWKFPAQSSPQKQPSPIWHPPIGTRPKVEGFFGRLFNHNINSEFPIFQVFFCAEGVLHPRPTLLNSETSVFDRCQPYRCLLADYSWRFYAPTTPSHTLHTWNLPNHRFSDAENNGTFPAKKNPEKSPSDEFQIFVDGLDNFFVCIQVDSHHHEVNSTRLTSPITTRSYQKSTATVLHLGHRAQGLPLFFLVK